MKNIELRSALIKSSIIVILCVFFIYAFAADDSGGVAGTIGSIFSGILFVVGLLFAIIVSIAVMFGIYFGILYMYDKKHCSDTYAEFKTKLMDTSKAMGCRCPIKHSSTKTDASSSKQVDLTPLLDNHEKLDSQLNTIQSTINSLEQTFTGFTAALASSTEKINSLDAKVQQTEETLAEKANTASVNDLTQKIAVDITTLQSSIKPLDTKLTELEKTLSDFSGKENNSELQEQLHNSIDGIKKELADMKKSIKDISVKSVTVSTEPNDTSHRLLSYFTKKADEKKFVKLVTDAIAKGMTYAQVDEYLNDSLSKEASDVIADHPSLTKDYIRICRQAS